MEKEKDIEEDCRSIKDRILILEVYKEELIHALDIMPNSSSNVALFINRVKEIYECIANLKISLHNEFCDVNNYSKIRFLGTPLRAQFHDPQYKRVRDLLRKCHKLYKEVQRLMDNISQSGSSKGSSYSSEYSEMASSVCSEDYSEAKQVEETERRLEEIQNFNEDSIQENDSKYNRKINSEAFGYNLKQQEMKHDDILKTPHNNINESTSWWNIAEYASLGTIASRGMSLGTRILLKNYDPKTIATRALMAYSTSGLVTAGVILGGIVYIGYRGIKKYQDSKTISINVSVKID